jgi:uncharacterized protein
MLIEFGFKNYFSFKEGASISLRLSGNVPENISHGRDLATALCIKGANASGKTNVLRAVSYLCNFAIKSFEALPDSKIYIAPHFDSKAPTEFYIEFRVGDTTYLYELTVTENEVLKEEIFRTKKKKVRIIGRTGDRIVFCNKEFDRIRKIKLRKNVSLISHARQHEYNELSELYEFFDRAISNVSFAGMHTDPMSDVDIAKWLHEAPNDTLDFVKKFIAECDTGVKDIAIFSRQKDELSESAVEYFPVFFHGEGTTLPITRHTESSGTRALFRRLGVYKTILELGGIVIADEIDVHLHPHILLKIVDLFLDPQTNTEGAQLLFTTHNTEVMNVLGRYRTYLVQKSDNESFAYRLDEIPGDILRNDRPIAPVYLDGKVGGVPKL